MGAHSAELAQGFSAAAFGRAAAELYRAEILKKHGDRTPLNVGEETLQWKKA